MERTMAQTNETNETNDCAKLVAKHRFHEYPVLIYLTLTYIAIQHSAMSCFIVPSTKTRGIERCASDRLKSEISKSADSAQATQ